MRGIHNLLAVPLALFIASGQAAAPVQSARPAVNPANQLSNPVPTLFTSKIGFFSAEQQGASYPRVIQLQVGAAKGTLLATFARRGSLPIFRSACFSRCQAILLVIGKPRAVRISAISSSVS